MPLLLGSPLAFASDLGFGSESVLGSAELAAYWSPACLVSRLATFISIHHRESSISELNSRK